MVLEKSCKTCYHNYHKGHTNNKCPHILMCHNHDKWIPLTNGEYLRSMSDDELVWFLCGRFECTSGCIGYEHCEIGGKNGIRAWLGEPVKEDDYY